MSGSSQIKFIALGKSNFDTWKLQVKAILVKNELWEYVSGEKTRPNGEKESKIWDTSDQKAMADLVLAIEPSELRHIKACKTSHEIWLKLHEVFQSKGPARKAYLLKQLTSCKAKEGENIEVHITKFFEIVDKLEELEISVNEDLLVIMLLESLPTSFENFRCAIETRDELPKIENLKIKVMEEFEARRKNVENYDSDNAEAMIAKKNWRSNRKKENRNDSSEDEERFRFKCHKCHKVGHKARNCYAQKKKERSSATGLHVSECEGSWCLDSGSSSHTCNDPEKYVSTEPSHVKYLHLANNSSTHIKAKGSVTFNVTNDTHCNLITLKDTLLVPDLRTNLMSVSKLTDDGHSVLFTQNKACVLDKNKNVIMVAKRKNDLYYVNEMLPSTKMIEPCINNIDFWHKNLGHLNEKDLRAMQANQNAIGLKFNKFDKLKNCDICLRGKLSKLPFPKKSERKTQLLELIHTDVCGPMNVPSIGGSKYFTVFIDDCTRWCEVYFLKHKNEALNVFIKYKNMVEKQTGRSIKILQSDNGTEYCNNEFDRFLNENGIKRRLTVPYTPQQNGVAERKMRTLVEMARCMMMEAGLSAGFWAEAVSTANHIRNRCCTASLDGDTPFRKWVGRCPVLTHFKIFGTKGFVLNDRPGKSKFEPRSTKCIFVGYSDVTKGYKIWIPEKKKFALSRNVKFVDNFENNNKFEEFYNDNFEKNITEEPIIEENIIMLDLNNDRNHYNFREEEVESRPVNQTHSEAGEENFPLVEERVVAKGDNVQMNKRRGRGRPKTKKSKSKDRPNKKCQPIFEQETIHEEQFGDPVNSSDDIQEFSGITEVPVKQALSGPDKNSWKNAILEEYQSILNKDTWVVVDRSSDRSVIGCRLILVNKYRADGTLDRRKARLVAKGYTQKPGIDFQETFAPVVRLSSLRVLLATAVKKGMTIDHVDVSTAFLNGELEEEIYMEIPDMFKDILEELSSSQEYREKVKAKCMLKEINKGNKVFLLKKAIYGLKQAGRQWNRKLHEILLQMKFVQLVSDPCIYKLERGEDKLFAAIYVDDIILTSTRTDWTNKVKQNLAHCFEIKDLKNIHHCLGIEFNHSRNEGKLSIKQEKYIESILERFNMVDCNPVVTPMEPNLKLELPKLPSKEEMSKYPYQELIGSLMYLSVGTRPDIAFSVSYLSQFNTNYSSEHWVAAKRVLRYLKGTKDFELRYSREGETIEGFADADWGSCTTDRRSYTGYVFKVAGGAVSWESRKQRTVALSSTEAEYMSLSEAGKEAIHLQRFLNELDMPVESIMLHVDNQGSLKLANNPVFHSRTKHIDVRHHFIRKLVEEGKMTLKYLSTQNMPADALTKALPKMKLDYCRNNVGLFKSS